MPATKALPTLAAATTSARRRFHGCKHDQRRPAGVWPKRCGLRCDGHGAVCPAIMASRPVVLMASVSLGGYRLDTGGLNHAAFSPSITAAVDLRNFCCAPPRHCKRWLVLQKFTRRDPIVISRALRN